MLEDLVGTGIEYRAEMLRLALIEARGQLDLSQRELAYAAGVPRYIINNYETDAAPLFKTEYLAKLADALGIELEDYGYRDVPKKTAARGSYKQRPRVHKKPPTVQYKHFKFGRAMQEVRLARGLTQGEAALAIGISPTTIAEWELGSVIPSRKNLTRWCVALGADCDAWQKSREGEAEKEK